MDKFITAGEKMGLTGRDLRDFVTEQMDKERQERAAHRELEKAKAETEKKKAEADVETAKAKAEADVESAKIKIQIEAETTKAKLDAEIQQKNLELEFQLKQHKQQLEHERELHKTKKDNSSRDSITIPQAPQLPMFVDGTDDMNSFLERFERIAKIQGWESENWAIMLSTLLSGTALDVYARLSSADAMNYKLVKMALLKRYNMTEEGFRSKFRSARPQKGENPSQFITRIRCYLNHWIDMAEIKSFDAFKDLIIREQFDNICPQELTQHLKEDQFVSMENMCEQAERYLEAHGQTLYSDTRKERSHIQPIDSNRPEAYTGSEQDRDSKSEYRQGKECYNCHKIGHIKTECRQQNGGNEQQCTNCKLFGHLAEVCRNTGTVIAGTMCVQNSSDRTKCTIGKRGYGTSLKTSKGIVGNHAVNIIRDSGCNSICVNKNLVSKKQMTGNFKVCKLMDGSEQKLPTALIDIDTPYLRKCNVTAVCLEKPIFDLVIGDVPGASCMCSPDLEWSSKAMPTISHYPEYDTWTEPDD